MKVKNPMVAKTRNYASRTYARKMGAQKKVALAVVPPAEGSMPFDQAMQSLFSLVGMMRKMCPEGAGSTLKPQLILTGTGMELRFAGAEPSKAAESEDCLVQLEHGMKLPGAGKPGKIEKVPTGWRERLARLEQGLTRVRQTTADLDANLSRGIRQLEEQLGAQSGVVDSLRCAVQQHEELMETLLDSMNATDDLSIGLPDLVLRPKSLAS